MGVRFYPNVLNQNDFNFKSRNATLLLKRKKHAIYFERNVHVAKFNLGH